MSAFGIPFAFLVMCGFFFFLISQSEKLQFCFPNLLKLLIFMFLIHYFLSFFSFAIVLLFFFN